MRTRIRYGPAILVLVIAGLASADQGVGPFAFFEPAVRVKPSERARLDAGDVLARVLPGEDGQLGLFAAVALDAPPAALVEWTRSIELLKRGPFVLAIGRVSNPPAETDLETLALERGEIDALRRCRVGSCDLKLSAGEIEGVQEAIRAGGDDWREAAQRAFRRVLIARVRLHQTRGLLALPPYADQGRRRSVGEAFSSIVARSPYLTRAFPDAVTAILMPGTDGARGGESFYYWSRERYGAGQTVISVTHVRLLLPDQPGGPRALSLGTQVYASHYIEGSLSLTTVLCDGARDRCYLVYVNRTQVDLLGGIFGAFKRQVIEGRIESDAPGLLRGVRQRLESGSPGIAPGGS